MGKFKIGELVRTELGDGLIAEYHEETDYYWVRKCGWFPSEDIKRIRKRAADRADKEAS